MDNTKRQHDNGSFGDGVNSPDRKKNEPFQSDLPGAPLLNDEKVEAEKIKREIPADERDWDEDRAQGGTLDPADRMNT